MQVTRSTAFLGLVLLLTVLAALAGVDAVRRHGNAVERLAENRAFVRAYELTDLCLFTDARYTRHPSVADRHSPFQDAPLSLEHFPSGSLASPPAHLARGSSGPADGQPGQTGGR